MRKWAWVLIGTAAPFLAGAGAAQDVPPGNEQAPIVVQGRRDRDAEIRELVESLPPASADGHISRFEHSACPAVIGLSPAQKLAMVSRMRAVGTAAGVPMGSSRCRANVVIIVTSDKRELIELLRRRFSFYLGDLSSPQIAALERSPEPAVWWPLNGLVDADGREVGSQLGSVPVVRTTRPASRITDEAHEEFVGSVLVVEARAVLNLTPVQLADYAAMRTFSGADPARLPDRNLSTILTVLDAPVGSEVPITLTHWDLAFLRSLYASDANDHAFEQRGEIRRGMDRRLDRPADRQEQH
jgi:hypothetical protein